MTCQKCGYIMRESEGKFCPRCGHERQPEGARETTCKTCGYTMKDSEGKFCPRCGHERQPEGACETNDEGQKSNAKNSPSMKWYKFLVYFSLWAGIVVSCWSATSYFSGSVYQGFGEKLYSMVPALQVVDVFYGVYILAMIAFDGIIWFYLKTYKSKGPRFLCASYIIGAVVGLAYMIIVVGLVGDMGTVGIGGYMNRKYLDLSTFSLSFGVSSVISACTSLFMALVNHVYFKNREKLFVN